MATSASNGLFGLPERVHKTVAHRIFECDSILHVPRSNTDWRIGPIQQGRLQTLGYDELYEDSDDKPASVEEVSALCVVIQIRGPNPGQKGCRSLRFTNPKDVANELRILKKLTRGKCNCTPQLIDFHVFQQTDGHYAPGDYVFILHMEKVPGYNIRNFGEFPLEKRDWVRIAFARAMR